MMLISTLQLTSFSIAGAGSFFLYPNLQTDTPFPASPKVGFGNLPYSWSAIKCDQKNVAKMV